MTTIYVLLLEEGKYYVGKTRNIEQRLKDHYEGNGSQWTKLYKPIEPIQIVENCVDFDEDKYVLIYMSKYGIDNVRGGTYTNLILDESTIGHINKMITSAKDRCFKCGECGHFVKDCRLLSQNNTKVCKGVQQKCERCGKSNHSTDKCYSKADKYGNLIGSTQRRLPPLSNSSNVCTNYGKNHFTQDCYDKTDDLITHSFKSENSIKTIDDAIKNPVLSPVTQEKDTKINNLKTDVQTHPNNEHPYINNEQPENLLDDNSYFDITNTGRKIVDQCIIS